MAHRIMDNSRFYALRTPAWHKLGTVSQEPLDAIAAADAAGIAALRTFTAPLWIRGNSGLLQAQGYKALCGCLAGTHNGGEHVTHTDGTTKTVYTYGVVSDAYEAILHHKALQLLHDATAGAPVETIGLLGKGDTLFITYELPTTDIKGDTLRNYLLLMNPLDGTTAVTARTTGVRVVCQNTLSMALRGQTEQQFRSIHSAGVADRLATWLAGVWQAQVDAVAAIQRACTLLADTRCTTVNMAQDILPAIYPFTPKPEETKLLDAWNEACLKQAAHRNVVSDLWRNSRTNSAATDGTLWGAYNAVCEYEDHARKYRTARSTWLGEGADRKRKAFDVCTALATA